MKGAFNQIFPSLLDHPISNDLLSLAQSLLIFLGGLRANRLNFN